VHCISALEAFEISGSIHPRQRRHTGGQVHPIDLVVCLLIVLVALALVARRLNVSYPIVLVLGGLILALLPRLPEVKLEPEIVFLVFLPPLLYWDAINSSWRDFRAHWRAITLLAIGLVFTTTMAVMLAAHFMLGLLWGPAFVLGAVLGPTDTVAAAALLERFSLPRRLSVILRGESLLNDALALVLYETAVHVTRTKAFIWGSVSLGFGQAAFGGIVIGLAVGWLMLRLWRLASDPTLGNTIALLTGFAAYLPADALHVSGVLAVVTAGLYLGWESPRSTSARMRLQSVATWEVITFLLNGLLFILIGLQLRPILESLAGGSLRSIVRASLLVSGTVILVRILWVFVSAFLSRAPGGRLAAPEPSPSWQEPALISWLGIRGGISLAAALAIPTTLVDGSPFPGRYEILIVTFAVILATLVLQGLTLPALLRRLHFPEKNQERLEENRAREAINRVALHYLSSAAKKEGIHPDAVEQLLDAYRKTLQASDPAPRTGSSPPGADLLKQLISLERELIPAQRRTLIDLRDRGAISDEVLRRFQLLLDLKEAQLEEEGR
jgi:monovalent cation/hydrogen antiporter